MYICKNCGQQYTTDEAVICIRCQAPRGMGENFCPFCGNQMPPGAKVCMNCGVDTEKYGQPVGRKSKVAAGLLGIFLGAYGVHNFYLGKKARAFTQLGITIGSIIFYICALFGGIFFENVGWALVAVILFTVCMLGVGIWGFVEGILILSGKIKRDGKGMLFERLMVILGIPIRYSNF